MEIGFTYVEKGKDELVSSHKSYASVYDELLAIAFQIDERPRNVVYVLCIDFESYIGEDSCLYEPMEIHIDENINTIFRAIDYFKEMTDNAPSNIGKIIHVGLFECVSYEWAYEMASPMREGSDLCYNEDEDDDGNDEPHGSSLN